MTTAPQQDKLKFTNEQLQAYKAAALRHGLSTAAWMSMTLDNAARGIVPQSHEHQNPGRPIQTIQQTAKIWKFAMLISMLIIVVAVFMIGFAATKSPVDNSGIALGILVGAFGFICAIISRIVAWWFHG